MTKSQNQNRAGQPTPLRVQIWIPDGATTAGGIQTFSRFFIRAVAECLPGADIQVLSKNDISSPQLPAHNPPLQFASSGRWPGRLRTPAFSVQLAIAVLRQRPDLVLSTHVNFAPVANWLKRWVPFRFAAVAHGIDVWGEGRRNLTTALAQADRLWAVSEFTRQQLLAQGGYCAERIGILPNTMDAERFQPGPKPVSLLSQLRIQAHQPILLTVARLASAQRYKGYDQILRCLPELRRRLPNLVYVIAGQGPDRPRLEALIHELGLGEAVRLAGFVPEAELPDYYRLADVFAMPSKAEGFGIVYLEALACGKPVLAGNKDGSVEALLYGKLGVLIDPDNLAELTDALSQMLRQEHPLPILRDPEALRSGVIAAYGYPQFKQRLADELRQLRPVNSAT